MNNIIWKRGLYKFGIIITIVKIIIITIIIVTTIIIINNNIKNNDNTVQPHRVEFVRDLIKVQDNESST